MCGRADGLRGFSSCGEIFSYIDTHSISHFMIEKIVRIIRI